MENTIGIAILNFNCSSYVDLVLDSLSRTKSTVRFKVGVIDNGSSAQDAEKCDSICKHYFQNNLLEGFFVRSELNLGFSGGNNKLIRLFLEDPSITHICLLNADVITTDFWLDRLLKQCCDVVGPVTNATGNEQTVFANYSIEPDTDAFDIVNEEASKRYEYYGDYSVETSELNFFATLISRNVFDTIGLLDERFYPGSFEDNDFCIRIKQAGFLMKIARGCYIHHFGSGSFSKLDMPARIEISNQNRSKFEEKWGIKWKDGTWKLLESCRQDISYLGEKGNTVIEAGNISSGLAEMERTLINWADAIAYYQSSQYTEHILETSEKTATPKSFQISANTILPSMVTRDLAYAALTGTELLQLSFRKAVKKMFKILHIYGLYRRIKEKAARAKDLQANSAVSCRQIDVSEHPAEEPHCHEEKAVDDIYSRILGFIGRDSSICIFAPIFNDANEKDGYFQRIKAIDNTVLKNLKKIYIVGTEAGCTYPVLEFIDDNHIFVRFDSFNSRQMDMIISLVKHCGRTYTHSVLRFMDDTVSHEMRSIFDIPNICHIWDVHGSVPEEYALIDSNEGYRIANEIEFFIYRRASVIVCVNDAMRCHLQKKWGPTGAKFAILPIFSSNLSPALSNMKKSDGKPIAVYCGGLQKWQNIEEMQDLISSSKTEAEYRIIVPDTELFEALWGSRPGKEKITIVSKKPSEIGEIYKICHYGFVLRDDIVVNNVACPTKIIEYIQYGIVPVLKSEKIGDFVALGMQYVKEEDFRNGVLPTEDARRKMAENNLAVLEKLKAEGENGLTKLSSEVVSPRKHNIGIVVTTFDKGGLEQIVLNLYHGFKKAGFETRLLCQKNILGSFAEFIEPDDLKVFNDNEESFISIVDEEEISILHYHYNTFLMQEMRNKGIRTLYTMHNVYAWKDDREIAEYAQILENADTVVPVSDFVGEYFIGRTKFSREKIQVIYNGIDFEELDLKEELPFEITREGLGISTDDTVFAFIASFYPAKGQCGMIGVMEQLARFKRNIKLLLVGNIGDSCYYERFKEHIAESPAKDSIIEVPYFAHKYIGEFLRKTADVFILPTLQEGCSNAVLEALYCRIPIILTDIGNARQISNLPSVSVVAPPYDDLKAMTNTEIILTSCEKDMKNRDEIVSAMINVTDNIDYYESEAKKLSDVSVFSTEHMVKQYIEIISKM